MQPRPIAYLNTYLATLCLCASLFFSLSAAAASPLTGKQIENWIASQQALQQWGDANADKIARYEAEMDRTEVNPMDFSAETMLKPLRASGLYSDAESIVKKNGFKTLEEWANMTIRISKAAASIEMDQMPEAFDMAEMQAMMNSQEFSDEQRAMMQQAIDQANMMRKQFTEGITAEDKQAVRPYLQQIMQIMEQES
ncbi:MAG: hypothetical protein R3183_01880 [Oleiphilaceae bacterium]|nr:hypothetical protein [Oleiphilaceae bacterium]